jgi:hypothetical protein
LQLRLNGIPGGAAIVGAELTAVRGRHHRAVIGGANAGDFDSLRERYGLPGLASVERAFKAAGLHDSPAETTPADGFSRRSLPQQIHALLGAKSSLILRGW